MEQVKGKKVSSKNISRINFMGAATLASACSLIPFKEASAGPMGDFFH